MSRKHNKPAATPPKPTEGPAGPPNPAADDAVRELQPRTLAPGEMLRPGDVSDPVAYADTLRDGRVREINRPPLEPAEPVFEVDADYKHPNDTAGKRWVKVELVRRDGNIGLVEEVPTEAMRSTVIENAKLGLLELHAEAVASHSEKPNALGDALLDGDARPAPDATNNGGADDPPPVSTAEAGPLPVTINEVLGDLAAHDGSHGALFTRPEPRLSAEQARTQSQIYEALVARGVPLRRQQDVYGWLLEQVAASAAKDIE